MPPPETMPGGSAGCGGCPPGCVSAREPPTAFRCPDVAGDAASRRYVPFFVAALALALSFGVTLGALNLARLTGVWAPLHRPSIWAHGYAQTFGFFGLFIMGFAYHALPRFFQTPLRYPAVVFWSLWLQLGGAACVSLAFVFLPDSARGGWRAGTAALLSAGALFGLSVLATTRARTAARQAIERWVVGGVVWLLGACLVALWAALDDDLGAHHTLWPMMLWGFVGSWIFGIGRRLFPASLGWQPRAPRAEALGFALYQLGVAGWSVGAWPAQVEALRLARGVGALALLVSVPLLAWTMGLFRARRASWRSADRDYESYIRTAWTWLFLALASGPAWNLPDLVAGRYGSLTMLDFARHTFVMGFAAQTIMGLACRFVPAFAGRRLWSRGVYRATFWLLNGSVALRGLEAIFAVGLWPAAWPAIALAGPPAVAAFALFALNILMVMRPGTGELARPRERGRAVVEVRVFGPQR